MTRSRILAGSALAVCLASAAWTRQTIASERSTPHSETKYHWCYAQFSDDQSRQHLVITDGTIAETHEDGSTGKTESAMLKQFRSQIEDQYSRKFSGASCRHYAYDRIQAELERSQMKLRFVGQYSRAGGQIDEVSFSFDSPDSGD